MPKMPLLRPRPRFSPYLFQLLSSCSINPPCRICTLEMPFCLLEDQKWRPPIVASNRSPSNHFYDVMTEELFFGITKLLIVKAKKEKKGVENELLPVFIFKKTHTQLAAAHRHRRRRSPIFSYFFIRRSSNLIRLLFSREVIEFEGALEFTMRTAVISFWKKSKKESPYFEFTAAND